MTKTQRVDSGRRVNLAESPEDAERVREAIDRLILEDSRAGVATIRRRVLDELGIDLTESQAANQKYASRRRVVRNGGRPSVAPAPARAKAESEPTAATEPIRAPIGETAPPDPPQEPDDDEKWSEGNVTPRSEVAELLRRVMEGEPKRPHVTVTQEPDGWLVSVRVLFVDRRHAAHVAAATLEAMATTLGSRV